MLFIWLCNLDFEINEKKSTSLFIIVDCGKCYCIYDFLLVFQKVKMMEIYYWESVNFSLIVSICFPFLSSFLVFSPLFFSPLFSLSILLSLLLSHVNLTTHESELSFLPSFTIVYFFLFSCSLFSLLSTFLSPQLLTLLNLTTCQLLQQGKKETFTHALRLPVAWNPLSIIIILRIMKPRFLGILVNTQHASLLTHWPRYLA